MASSLFSLQGCVARFTQAHDFPRTANLRVFKPCFVRMKKNKVGGYCRLFCFTFYDFLGVSMDATQDNIKEAYRKSVKIWHPDIVAVKSTVVVEDANEEFMKIHDAYSVLSDPDTRARYDESLMKRSRRFDLMKKSFAEGRFAGISLDDQDIEFSCKNWETDQCW